MNNCIKYYTNSQQIVNSSINVNLDVGTKKSTIQALINYKNIIMKPENKKHVAVLCLEMPKAFDTGNQEILLLQLRTVRLPWPGRGVAVKLDDRKKPLCTWN